MVGKVIVRDELGKKQSGTRQETRGAGTTRLGAALASPIGVMIVIPALVVAVGLLSTLVGQRALRETNLNAAEELLTETSAAASQRLQRTLSQAEAVLSRLDDVARRTDRNDPAAIGIVMRDLFLDRAGMTQMYVGYADGRFLGVYEEGHGLRFQDSQIGADGKTTIAHYVLGLQQDFTFLEQQDADYDPRKRAWYKEAGAARARIWSKPYVFFTTGRTGVTRAAPVYGEHGKLDAVVGLDYDATALSNLFTDANRSWVRVLVFGPGGVILAYPSARATIEALPRSSEALTYEKLNDPVLNAYFRPQGEGETEHGMRLLNVQGRHFLSAEAEVKGVGLDWKVVALAEEDVVLAELHRHQQQSLLIAFGAVCVALVISWLFARHVVRARRQVAQAREEAAQAVRQVAELGSYRLLDCLGKGGMGEVWRAEHRLLARQAAVKLINADLEGNDNVEEVRERFKREAKAIAALKSRNTIALFDYGVTSDGTFFYVMEMLDGIDLETLVDKYGRQSPGRVISVLVQACNSLAEAHDSGLVHRDIKPANLFLCRAADEVDVLKVLDFGLVRGPDGDDLSSLVIDKKIGLDLEATTDRRRASGSDADTDVDGSDADPQISARLTRAGDYLGTPAFMAPEQALGQEIDGRADLYALGCVGWWLLTGRLPFEEPHAVAMLVAHIQKEPVGLKELCPDVPAELEAVILSCMAKQPALRPKTARHLAESLRHISKPEEIDFPESSARDWWDSHRPPSVKSSFTAMKTILHSAE